MYRNEFNQPIGHPVDNYQIGATPRITRLQGKSCYIEPLSGSKHLAAVADCYFNHMQPQDWTYLPAGPFIEHSKAAELVQTFANSVDPYYLVILNSANDDVLGTFALSRINQKYRIVEMGWVLYSDRLKHSKAATEAQFLMMRYVFETLHYRRYEWKCDSLNQPSRQAAERLGFRYEGTFRNAMVYKNRSRDTDWLSIIDEEWETLKARFENYLSDDNFDAQGQQIKSLNQF